MHNPETELYGSLLNKLAKVQELLELSQTPCYSPLNFGLNGAILPSQNLLCAFKVQKN